MKPHIIDFNAPNAGAEFATSLHQTGFAIIVIKNGQKGVYKNQIQQALQENIAFFNLPFEQKIGSLFLEDPKKDAGWFPLGSEGRTDGPPNLLEYVHHRPDMRHVNFKPMEFPDTWNTFTGMHRLAEKLTTWLVEHLPAEHPMRSNMHHLSSQVDDKLRSVVRALKYLPHHPLHPEILPEFDEKKEIRLWNDPHEDADWLTLIPVQTKPGLQLQDNKGNWYNVPWTGERSDTDDILIVVNAGDTLSAASGGTFALCESSRRPDGTVDKLHNPLTFEGWRDADEALMMWRDGYYHTHRKLRLIQQGYYPSTTHRVVAGSEVRYSMPYFFHITGWTKVSGLWTAYDKMRGYVRNKEAQRQQALEAIYRAHGLPVPKL